MDLFKILDTTPEPPIINLAHSKNTSGDYVLPIPLTDYQKELMDQIVSLHYSDILKYYELNDKSQLLLDSLNKLYENTHLVSIHPYLLITHYLPKNLNSKDLPYNLVETSGKFKVLLDLIKLLESKPLDIAITVKSSGVKSLDLLESLLLSLKTNVKRHSGNYIKDPSKVKNNYPLTTHLISNDEVNTNLEKYDLLFSFDISSKDELLNSLRKNIKTPIIRFITTNSIEHITHYFSKENPNKTFNELFNYIISAIVVLRDRVGVLSPDLRPIYTKNLTYLNSWFQNFHENPWPLPDLPPIQIYDSVDVEKSLLSEVLYEKVTNHKENKKTKSYYETKRLNKDYTSNPLKNLNFGILSINSNYNDSLTHKLIQEFNVLESALLVQKSEFKLYEIFENNKKQFTETDESNLLTELTQLTSTNNTEKEKGDSLTERIDDVKSKIKFAEEEIKSHETDNAFFQIDALKQDIARETLKGTNLSNEHNYLSSEIENAKKSIVESEVSIETLKKEIQNNENAFDDYFKDFEDQPLETVELKELKSKISSLKSSIEDSLTKLNSNRSRNDNRRISPSIK